MPPLTLSFSLFASTPEKLRAQLNKNRCGNIFSAKSERKQNQWPITSHILWRSLHCCQNHKSQLTYSAINSSEWGIRSPVWLKTITMAWQSLGINCGSWHASLTVSNSPCDLCTAASNILLEGSHKSTPDKLCALSFSVPALIVYMKMASTWSNTACCIFSAFSCHTNLSLEVISGPISHNIKTNDRFSRKHFSNFSNT